MNNVKFIHIKNAVIYSLILGAICSLAALIPYFMPFIALFFIPFLGSIPVFILLIKRDNFNSGDYKDYAIIGAISGLFLGVSYFPIWCILVSIIHFIFKSYSDYGMGHVGIFLFTVFLVMILLVYSITNAGVGLLGGIIHIFIKGKINEQ